MQQGHSLANYRWSADGAAGRKRESLYDDNGEPSSSSSGARAGGGWPEEGLDAPDGEQQLLQGQQQAWEAADTDDGSSLRSSRLGRRRARASPVVGSGRLSRRRQEAAERAAAEQGAAPAGDPEDAWVQAELRQLRRRQQAAAAGREAAAAPVPDPVAQDWGPLEGAPAAAAAAAEDWGWAAESWASGVRSNGSSSRQRGQQAAAEAGAGAGSAWELAQQQRELRRQRRRARAAAARDAPQAPAADGGATYGGAAAGGAYAAPGDGQQYSSERYGGEYGPGYDAYATQQQQAGRYDGDGAEGASWQERYGDDGGQYTEAYEPGVTAEPDIALLSSDELDRVLPVIPFAQQASFYGGTATDGVQRWGASLAATVVLSKVAVLAATSLTWPLWWPWALAAKKNLALRRQFSYGGLWRTQVLEVAITGRPKPFTALDGGERGGTMRMARILVGDPGGARAEMVLPYDSRYELIQAGEAAELLVLSSDTSFRRFKAVKDVYLPSSGLWVSEYPHADRTRFLEVEREAQAEAEAQQYGGGAAGQAGEQPGGGAWQPDDYSGARY
ncbi:hypothetical protein CHLNCDRAFT_138041 [Chlorella variabilis]|uniref:Uncharacterized protein n=1 Tax=Chlorella variabilis TaxID=554065 RepID=E1Z546_CHLVA|nr:hypothetical protein CHLNCDRAFT_138041 [Chlorella variabilis]EFN59167.1 hypothetical protein CHLNCDRAFT_138041 [Chlorella variabilis]|eukprot:XP_005851269.1 hypothetical protein CHLNCDRAFT_138041 [Chlorella variabilis]